MTESTEWKRPDQVETFRTSDPKEMIGKYLPKSVLRTWKEDFMDEDTHEVVTIERNEIICDAGAINQDKLQQIMFAIQAGDIDGVEVSNEDIRPMQIQTAGYLIPYSLEIERWCGCDIVKDHYVCYARDIPEAMRIACEFGQMYRGFNGDVKVNRVVRMDAQMVPDNHQCIPEADRKPADEPKDYFKVTVRHDYIDGNLKQKHYDTHYIIAAKDVGEAKDRIALLLEILKAEAEKRDGVKAEDRDSHDTIRKAQPFEVDCIVPKAFTELYTNKEDV